MKNKQKNIKKDQVKTDFFAEELARILIEQAKREINKKNEHKSTQKKESDV